MARANSIGDRGSTRPRLEGGRRLSAAVVAVVLGASPSLAWQLTGLRVAQDLAHDGTALYVTGSVPSGPATVFNHGLATLRIDPETGSEIWRYVRDDADFFDIGGRIVTTAAGDVVTGDDVSAFRVIKLAGSSGSEQWVYDDPDGSDIEDLAIDSSDDVIAAGVFGSGAAHKLAVVKLSGTDGSELWRYVIGGTADDFGVRARRVAVAANDDVVVAGVLANAGTGDDFTVVRLDGTTGGELWRVEIDGGLAQTDAADAVGIDAAGDVYAAGVLRTPTGSSGTVKLSGATGAEIWRDSWPDVSSGTAMELDPTGAPIVGRLVVVDVQVPVEVAATLSKLDPSTGVPDWTTATPALPHPLALTTTGDVLTGFSTPSGITFARYAGADGQLLWARKVTTTFSGYVTSLVEVGDRVFTAAHLGNEAQVIGTAEGLAGKKLTFKEKAPTDQKLVLVTKDPLLFAPGIGGPNDPAVGGATLELRNPDSGESTTLDLPAAGWSAKPGRQLGSVRWKYSNAATASECLRVGLTSSRKLAIKCAGDLGFSLDEPMQGTLIAILTYAGGHRHCLTFGGDVVVDDPGRFVAKSALPEVCPD